MWRPLFVILTALAFISCNSAEKTPEPKTENATLDKQWAKSFLDSINIKFSEQIAAGDSVALAAHYWPDAQLLLDNSEPVKGADILSAWGGVIQIGVKEMTFSTTDIAGSPTFIIETGNYEMKDANKSLLDRGKYVVIWEKRNGEWKLYRDIGCTSMPLAK